MNVCHKIYSNLYQDSVSLMQVSTQLNRLAGIEKASVMMGTPTNLALLSSAGLGEDFQAGPNDLIVVVKGETTANQEALSLAHTLLSSKPTEETAAAIIPLTSFEMALESRPEANLALISVPGDYAAAEALKALNLGMNVMLFSDNVPVALEKKINRHAQKRNLLVMGPDCGTAIINGIPLGFANVVRRGSIGVVGASGTGVQEVTCRIHQLGAGISQALGTGGHDLSESIGGISMLTGLNALAQDPATQVIVLISKPPSQQVAEQILQAAEKAGKPVVVNFLGADPGTLSRPGIVAATTLAGAAEAAVGLAMNTTVASSTAAFCASELVRLQQACVSLAPDRSHIRGVFAGGTFCYEAQLLCQQQQLFAASNTPVAGNGLLEDINLSQGHTLVDMGDDDFTRGKPHPMIDPTLRNQRIAQELSDPTTAVVLFDVVLGYGAAQDPVADLLPMLQQRPQNGPAIVAHVCGTDADPQDRQRQLDALAGAGVMVAGCNAQAAQWAAAVAQIQANKKEAQHEHSL